MVVLIEYLAVAAATESKEGLRSIFPFEFITTKLEINAIAHTVFNTQS